VGSGCVFVDGLGYGESALARIRLLLGASPPGMFCRTFSDGSKAPALPVVEGCLQAGLGYPHGTARRTLVVRVPELA
jgi:hypothetical protein